MPRMTALPAQTCCPINPLPTPARHASAKARESMCQREGWTKATGAKKRAFYSVAEVGEGRLRGTGLLASFFELFKNGDDVGDDDFNEVNSIPDLGLEPTTLRSGIAGSNTGASRPPQDSSGL